MVKIKTFEASSAKKLNQRVDEFLADPAVELVRVHLSSNAFGAWVLIEYESRSG